MTREQLLFFGRAWHYPFLALPDAPLRHGKDAYAQATSEQLAQASQRIARWNTLAMSEHLDQTISIIDELLKSCRVERTPQESEMGMSTATRGFASLPPELRKEMAAKGGRASQVSKTPPPHWTSEEAAKAGSIGGKISKRPATSYSKRVPEGEQLV